MIKTLFLLGEKDRFRIMNKALLIINPVSGRGALPDKSLKILNLFCKNGIVPTVMFTQYRGHAREIAATCSDAYDLVICCGGDGTLNEVISGLLINPFVHKLGYIPAGTTNDFAKSLNLSPNVEKAVKDIIAGYSQPLDIGKINGKTFNYVASFGAFSEASYDTPQRSKNKFGHLAYIFKGIKCLKNIHPYNISVEFDGNKITGDFIFGAICNTTSIGGVLRFDQKQVSLNDGKFEILLIRAPRSFRQLLRIVFSLLKRNFQNDLVTMYHASKISIMTTKHFDWSLDGEKLLGQNKLFVENMPSVIDFIVPKAM